jgi:hypothetical protein
MSKSALLDASGEQVNFWSPPHGRQQFFGWRDRSGQMLTVRVDDIAMLVEMPDGNFNVVLRSITMNGKPYIQTIPCEDGLRLMKTFGWTEPGLGR